MAVGRQCRISSGVGCKNVQVPQTDDSARPMKSGRQEQLRNAGRSYEGEGVLGCFRWYCSSSQRGSGFQRLVFCRQRRRFRDRRLRVAKTATANRTRRSRVAGDGDGNGRRRQLEGRDGGERTRGREPEGKSEGVRLMEVVGVGRRWEWKVRMGLCSSLLPPSHSTEVVDWRQLAGSEQVDRACTGRD
jgi:hypothetical protein